MHASGPADKQRLRVQFSAVRAARSDASRQLARAAVRDVVLAQAEAAGWRSVAGYLPLRTEPGSMQLLSGLVALGARVLVPITLPDRDLEWAEWTTGGLGDQLPADAVADAEAVLAPALAVARDGTRLGRGGGSYDRALSRCSPGTVVAALLYEGELVAELPSDPWDRPVTAVATPSAWISLESPAPPGR
jgi:5-formyltetrahydrofolate cyclo-ligase